MTRMVILLYRKIKIKIIKNWAMSKHIFILKKKKKSVFATAHLGYLVFMVVVGIVSLTPPYGREGPYGSERQFLLLPTS